MGDAFEFCIIQIPTSSPTLPGRRGIIVGHNIDRCITVLGNIYTIEDPSFTGDYEAKLWLNTEPLSDEMNSIML